MSRLLSAVSILILPLGCATTPASPIPTAADVNLERFMGDWYVIACTPLWADTEAYDAVESYRLEPDGTIATTYTFRDGGFDGPVKTYRPTGFVRDEVNNSTWGMQFFWPIKAEYLISYLDAEYTQTIIARSARDLVWIMARTPAISEADYERLVARVKSWGYDVGKLRRVPHRGQEPSAG